MEISFKYKVAEYVDAKRKYLYMSKSVTPLTLIMFVGFFIFAVLMLVKKVSPLSLGMFAAWAFFAITLYVLLISQPKSTYKKNKDLQADYTIKFNNKSINLTMGEEAIKENWESFKELWGNWEYYYLIREKGNYLLIPKRAFKDEEEAKSFKDLYLKNNKNGIYKGFK